MDVHVWKAVRWTFGGPTRFCQRRKTHSCSQLKTSPRIPGDNALNTRRARRGRVLARSISPHTRPHTHRHQVSTLSGPLSADHSRQARSLPHTPSLATASWTVGCCGTRPRAIACARPWSFSILVGIFFFFFLCLFCCLFLVFYFSSYPADMTSRSQTTSMRGAIGPTSS